MWSTRTEVMSSNLTELCSYLHSRSWLSKTPIQIRQVRGTSQGEGAKSQAAHPKISGISNAAENIALVV